MALSNFIKRHIKKLWGEQEVEPSPEIMESLARINESSTKLSVASRILVEVDKTEKLLGRR